MAYSNIKLNEVARGGDFCHFEPVLKKIEHARILVIDDLLRNENDLSQTAHREWGDHLCAHLKRERTIAALALENIINNIKRLVVHPESKIVHLSELQEASVRFQPDAILLSGSLSDFDFYHPDLIRRFGDFVRSTSIPMLGICGGHQLLGLAFGARVVTLDKLEQFEQRERRIYEYQYRYVRIVENEDPIFTGLDNSRDDRSGLLRVWQNHGLQLDRVPEGFKLLATSYLCRNQMMVKRDNCQLIYAVQFHLEKSFEDWYQSRTRWQHPNDSRDGRIIFENFLKEALKSGMVLKGVIN